MRVFRLLGDLKQLEQKQVAEKAMLPTKDTRELLYSMLKAGIVSLQVCLLLFHLADIAVKAYAPVLGWA